MTGARTWHDYDMYGHEPGCALCAAQREQQAEHANAIWAKAQTPLKNSSVELIFKIDGEVFSIAHFNLRAGQQVDPMRFALSAQSTGYDVVKFINKNDASES